MIISSEIRARVNAIRQSGFFVEREYALSGEALRQRMDSVQHYLLVGEARGARPSTKFDPAYYRRKYGIEGDSPLIHFLLLGQKQGFSPRRVVEEFDLTNYAFRAGQKRIIVAGDGGHGPAAEAFDAYVRLLRPYADVIAVSLSGRGKFAELKRHAAAVAAPRVELPEVWAYDTQDAAAFVGWLMGKCQTEEVVLADEMGLVLCPAFSRLFLPTVWVSGGFELQVPWKMRDLSFAHTSVIVSREATVTENLLSLYPALRSRRVLTAEHSADSGGAEENGLARAVEEAFALAKPQADGLRTQHETLLGRADIGQQLLNSSETREAHLSRVRDAILIRGRDTGQGPTFTSPRIEQSDQFELRTILQIECGVQVPETGVKRVIRPKRDILLPPGVRVALQGHYYYPDLLTEVLDFLSVNTVRPDLFLSTDSEDKKEQLLRSAGSRGFHADVRVVPNRGRDIGPLVTGFADLFETGRYDIVGHIHGKKSPHIAGSRGQEWRQSLLDQLIGRENPMMDTVTSEMCGNPRIGLVFPSIPNSCAWDNNYRWGEQLAARMKLRADISRPFFEYPAGTMFWCRPQALLPVLQMGLGWEDYPDEPVPQDGTILHGIERILPFVCESQGFENATISLVPAEG